MRPFWSCDQHRLIFFLLHPKEAPLWNLASIGPVVSEEKMFENVDIHTYIHTYTHTYIHTHITYTHIYTYIHEAFLYYQLTYELKGSGELKRSFFQRKEFNIFSEGTRISMPMIPIHGKNLKKSSSPEPHGRWPWNLVCSIGCSSTTMFVQIITIGWPWYILWQGQIWSLMLLYGKKVKQWIFSETIVVYNLKLATDD